MKLSSLSYLMVLLLSSVASPTLALLLDPERPRVKSPGQLWRAGLAYIILHAYYVYKMEAAMYGADNAKAGSGCVGADLTEVCNFYEFVQNIQGPSSDFNPPYTQFDQFGIDSFFPDGQWVIQQLFNRSYGFHAYSLSKMHLAMGNLTRDNPSIIVRDRDLFRALTDSFEDCRTALTRGGSPYFSEDSDDIVNARRYLENAYSNLGASETAGLIKHLS